MKESAVLRSVPRESFRKTLRLNREPWFAIALILDFVGPPRQPCIFAFWDRQTRTAPCP